MHIVSVLLPNYNNGPYLKECLDSLHNQIFKDFEIVFVDDCSTDNSLQIVKDYPGLNFKIVIKESNSGIVDTLNKGLEIIDSKYIIRMDGDDIATPDRFSSLFTFMEANPHIGVCSSNIQTFGENNEVWQFESDPLMNKANLIFGHSVGHASSIFRTEIFRKYGVRYENVYWRMEDFHLFYKLKDIAEVTNISQCLYLYRKGEYNDNETIWNRKRDEYRKIYKMILLETGLNPDKDSVEMHLQLNRVASPSYSLKQYENHCDAILKANKKAKNFPERELKIVLERNLKQMVFRQIDAGKVNMINSFISTFRYPGVFKYYLTRHFFRRKGI